MPRPREYNESVVLEAAVRVFWEHGYGSTTRQLGEAMGINPYSVYASFGSKAGLFARALEHYVDRVDDVMLPPLLAEHAAMPELREFLENVVRTSESDAPNGCLVCNTMIDDAEHTPPVLDALERYQNRVTSLFARALQNAFPEMPKAVVGDRVALLFSALLGLFVQMKMGARGRAIQRTVDEVMNAVQRSYTS